MKTVNLIFYLIFFVSFSQMSFAQQDSLADVFPLRLGNKWTYEFDNAQSGMGTLERDIGTGIYQVTTINISVDSIRWQIFGKRDFTRYWSDHGIPSGSSHMHDSVSFEIIELTSGFHELFVSGSPNHAYDVFPLWRLYGDTIQFNRYRMIDSTGVVSINKCRCSYLPNIYRNLTMQKDVGITKSSGSELSGGVGSWNWNYSMKSFLKTYSGPHLMFQKDISLSGYSGIPIDTSITLTCNGTEAVQIYSVTSSNPAINVFLSSWTIPSLSNAILSIKHTSPPDGSSSARIVVLSSSVTSPDTIEIAYQARKAAVLKVSNSIIDFGDVFQSRRYLDTTMYVRNVGNLPIAIDSIITSDPSSYFPPYAPLSWELDRWTLNSGDSAACRLRFGFTTRTLDQRANLILYSNATSSPDIINIKSQVIGGMILFSSHSISFDTTEVDGLLIGNLFLTGVYDDVIIQRTRPSNPVFTIPNSMPNVIGGTFTDTILFAPRTVGLHTGYVIYSSRSTNASDSIPAIDTIWLSGVGIQTKSIPTQYSLNQNYPNPFNPGTRIRFDIPTAGYVTLKVFDLLGREVATMVNEDMYPGSYEKPFDGSGLSSGVYLYRLHCGNFAQTKKLLLIR